MRHSPRRGREECIGAGVLLTPAVAHPDVFDVGFATAAAGPWWVVMHVCWIAAAVLSIFGLAGLVVAHGRRLGRLGWAGTVVTIPPGRRRLPHVVRGGGHARTGPYRP